ncbi:hypothetical protein BTUL_0156g00170 [Botrytis tulipae]|uniref:Uncharacterized protein n=1 Tax=Botrytis tulipae TaxID=87230 RepID=A0A4Z1EKA1_9HELO|nr:hypothetical protein BTUL_0156g00170 [Botrytis tulipae]
MAARDLTSQHSNSPFASTAQHNYKSVVKYCGTRERSRPTNDRSIVGQWTLHNNASSTNPASVDGLISTESSKFLTVRPNTLVRSFMVKDVQMMQWRMEHTLNNGLAFYAIVLHKSAKFNLTPQV